MRHRALPLLALASLAWTTACTQQVPLRMAVEVVAEPEQADVTFKGKDLGSTPASLEVKTFEELMTIGARRENADAVEKRIRILAPDKAQLIFRFGDVSPLAKKLGYSKVLVFDYSERVSFDSSKSELKPDALTILNRQAEILKTSFPGVDVNVCGHTDSTGGDDLNLKLSIDRAQAVSDYLAAAGVPGAKLKPQGFGKDYPITTNATPEGRGMNRRTELILPQ